MGRGCGQRVVALYMVLAAIPLTCPRASALDPKLDVNQYAHTAWKIRGGFANGEIISIAQTPDGYLWLGTQFGLLRFDGVRNVPWQPPSGQHLPSNSVYSLLTAHDGTLWIGTGKGLASWKDGKLTQYAEFTENYVFALLEDRDGVVWAGGVGIGAHTGQLCAIQKGALRCYGEDGTFGRGVAGLYQDRKGNLWVGVETGLWRWKPGPPKFYSLADEPNGIQALGEDADGTLLVGWKGGIQRFIDGRMEPYLFTGFVRQFVARRILRDRDGSLWIGTFNHGLLHAHGGRIDVFQQSDGLSGDAVNALFEDREGNIWIVTGAGLDRFRDLAVATFSVNQGLSKALVGSILADRDGSIWLGTYGGLNRWNSGEITIPLTGSKKRDGKINGLHPDSLFQDSRGRIWVSTVRQIGYLEDDRFVTLNGAPGGFVLSIAQDRAGNLWLANETLGLFRVSRPSQIRQIPWAALGHKDHASILAADPSQGGLWIGFFLGGIAYFSDGQISASYTTADGLGEGRVSGFLFDHDGAMWISTDGGLSRLKNGRVSTLTSKNGLPCDTVHWAMEDDDHSFWLYMACGLVRITRPELDAWVADPRRTIQVTVFDTFDGVRNLAQGGHYSPLVAKTPDGRIWFLPWDGVSVFDPHNLHFNKLPPPVHIEQVTADRKAYDATSQTRLPPLVRDLEIDYTALSLVAPEKVRYRYKLEGLDRDWQDAGNRRQAFYTNLSPGNYTFRVMACNNTGVWNETGAALDFFIAPAYYQTKWFRALCLAVFLGLLWWLYQLRIRSIERRNRGLRDVIDAIPALAWCNMPDGSNEFLNRNWHEYTGLSPEESHGWGWQAAFHQEDLPPLMDKWRKMLISGEPDEVEARIRRHDGVYRWFLIRAEPLRDENGEIVRWYGTSTDIEDRKKAEQALQASERNLTLIINTIPTYIQVLRSDGSVLYRNQAVLDYFGITPEDLEKEDHRARYFHPEDVERLREERRVALTRPVPFEHEQRLMGKDGRYHWFLIRYSPLLDEQGRIERWYVAAFDIEDRKRAEESLRQAQAELAHVTRVTTLGGLTASIAHEVNQPLSGIVSNASACLRWLAGDMPNLEEARQAAQRIVRDGKRAGEVIVRVRALATKKASAQREKLDLNGTIQEVLALVGDEAKKKNVIMRTEFADDLVPVSGDRVQLQQVTLNLVMNAIEAMSNNEGHRIRDLVVTTRNIDTSQVLVTVEDSGPGIAPEMMGRIFDSFYTTKPGGMGLGLSISRSILQAHGGRLWATVKDGTGTVFHVTLPNYHEEKSDAGAKAV